MADIRDFLNQSARTDYEGENLTIAEAVRFSDERMQRDRLGSCCMPGIGYDYEAEMKKYQQDADAHRRVDNEYGICPGFATIESHKTDGDADDKYDLQPQTARNQQIPKAKKAR